MAEKQGPSADSGQSKRSQKPHHSPKHYYKPQSSYHYNHHNRFSDLGVKDLREILDKKRQERGETEATPPHPNNGHLRDHLREKEDRTNKKEKHQFQNKEWKKENNFKNKYKDSQTNHRNDIENPSNIKIEFTPSTGERIYTLDEATILPTIKHIPDKKQFYYRGRGRGRGRGTRGYRSRPLNKNYSSQQKEHVEESLKLQEDVEILQESMEQWKGVNEKEQDDADVIENENQPEFSNGDDKAKRESVKEVHQEQIDMNKEKENIKVQIDRNQTKTVKFEENEDLSQV